MKATRFEKAIPFTIYYSPFTSRRLMMNVEWMRGCATALVTPFKSDGSVDIERMRALVARQMEGGVRLLVPCGTTGESVTMSSEERDRVVRATIETARGRARVIAGTGSNNTRSEERRVGKEGRSRRAAGDE